MRALWRDEPATYHGETVSFDRVHCTPRPAAGSIPIVVGGNSAPAVERAGRTADGWFPYTVTPEELATKAVDVARAADDTGRSIDDITISVWPGSADAAREFDAAWVKQFVDVGARRQIVFRTHPERAGAETDAVRLRRHRIEQRLIILRRRGDARQSEQRARRVVGMQRQRHAERFGNGGDAREELDQMPAQHRGIDAAIQL